MRICKGTEVCIRFRVPAQCSGLFATMVKVRSRGGLARSQMVEIAKSSCKNWYVKDSQPYLYLLLTDNAICVLIDVTIAHVTWLRALCFDFVVIFPKRILSVQRRSCVGIENHVVHFNCRIQHTIRDSKKGESKPSHITCQRPSPPHYQSLLISHT
jgi:hypothetical protein